MRRPTSDCSAPAGGPRERRCRPGSAAWPASAARRRPDSRTTKSLTNWPRDGNLRTTCALGVAASGAICHLIRCLCSGRTALPSWSGVRRKQAATRARPSPRAGAYTKQLYGRPGPRCRGGTFGNGRRPATARLTDGISNGRRAAKSSAARIEGQGDGRRHSSTLLPLGGDAGQYRDRSVQIRTVRDLQRAGKDQGRPRAGAALPTNDKYAPWMPSGDRLCRRLQHWRTRSGRPTVDPASPPNGFLRAR